MGRRRRVGLGGFSTNLPESAPSLSYRYAAALTSFLEDEFHSKVAVTSAPTPCTTGAFEVKANGTLIHSKLTKGHGKCETDAELDAILETIQAML
ncbi:hypothetical protein AB1Y20_003622 [Prymnesium parvum]|uniref:Selenoprotein W n=1 Tax=Prymnesium parvum TaxID=97485 RepID=A0AB34J7H4_PRYPA